MDGVMMRNGEIYSVAVRQPDGSICAQRLPWINLVGRSWLRLPFLRGFPTLLETMINGIHALNLSARLAEGGCEAQSRQTAWNVALSLCIALGMALGLFVLAPHLLSLLMLSLKLGGDVDGLSFHLWDGLYKCAIFVAYIWLISLVPDIRRVFQYHGAEHKTIHAWEAGDGFSASAARGMSRLHPRCGTTFLLFVICISIILQAALVPLFLKIWPPQGMFARHAFAIGLKLLLVIPISALAYELIRFAAAMPDGLLASILRAPGLFLQKLTTREPDGAQLDVAMTALAAALDENWEEKAEAQRRLKPEEARSDNVC